jgi:hypothetical protein
MTRRVQLPHMVRRGRIWSAVVRVPADVCAALGRSVCKETTGEEGPGKGLGQGPALDQGLEGPDRGSP